MTRGSIREYTEAVRGRYLGPGKNEKGRECGNKSEDCFMPTMGPLHSPRAEIKFAVDEWCYNLLDYVCRIIGV